MADVMVGLPGSLSTAANLYRAWTKGQDRPVVLLNRNRAFEAMRGFAGDIISHGLPRNDRRIQFAESVEDAWNKTTWLIAERDKTLPK